MSREDEAKNERLFDSRTVERNIRKGLITRKDYDKHLKGLVDVTDKIAPPEAPRSVTLTAAAADTELDHLDAGLDDDDDEDLDAPVAGQSAAAEGDEDLGDADLDEDDLEDDEDDEDEVDSEPPKN